MYSNINRKPLTLDENYHEKNPYKLLTTNTDNVNSGYQINIINDNDIKTSSIRINKTKDRIFILAPKVKSGEDRECNFEDFNILDEKIRYGCLGFLRTTIHKASKNQYALKIIKKEEIEKLKLVDKMNDFIDSNYRYGNSNLIKYVTHFEEENYLVFIYSLMKLNLLDFINKHFSNDDFYENLSMQFFIQAVGGVLFLNTNKKYNINIRPENIMIDKQNIIKITDLKDKDIMNNFFGEKKLSNKEILVDYYTTPEELNLLEKNELFELPNLDKNDKLDVWKIGGLLFHLLTSKAPYEIYDNLSILKNPANNIQKKASFLRDLINNKELKITDNTGIKNSSSSVTEFNKKIDTLVKLFMNPSLQNRINLKELKENSILKSLLSKYKLSRSSTDFSTANKTTSNASKLLTADTKSPSIFTKRMDPNSDSTMIKFSSDGSCEFESLSLENKYTIIFDENFKMKKNLEKYKKENERLEKENKLINSEIMNIKESYEKDQKNLKEEKIKLNSVNQDRISKINELDEMSNEIIELKSKLRKFENENEMNQIDLAEMTEKAESLQNIIDELNINFENEKSELKIKIESLTKNCKMMQKNFLGNESINFNNEEGFKKFAVALFDLVKEFRENLDKFIKNNYNDKNDILYKINNMLNEKEESIKNYIKKIKDNFIDDYLRISFKPASGNSVKTKERFEWIQKQVNELTPFKIKSINLENANYKLNKENKIISEMLILKETEIDLLKKIMEGNIDNQKNSTDYIAYLEAMLCYFKDFVFKNFPTCLDELKF